ncbi:cysteine-rich small domain-containing protein [Anaerovoracaceae bacterium 42-11]
MNVNWFKNPDHVVYADAQEFVGNFAKETGISDLKERIEDFEANPNPDGVILKGRKRTSIKLFIPDMVFDEHIEMGENVWVYMGENYECYCLYNISDRGFYDEAENFKFFSHRECEYFPCHETKETEQFNCLFCYCPLYAMGRDCGGNYAYTSDGVKDCSDCMIPHRKDNFDYMMARLAKFHKKLQLAEKEG